MPRTKTKTLSFKAAPEVEKRLEDAAAVLGLSKSTIFLAAVDAALAAIERDRGIVFPVEFTVKRVPSAPAEKPLTPTAEDLLAREKERRRVRQQRTDAAHTESG